MATALLKEDQGLVNITDFDGNTPLIIAAQGNHGPMVSILLACEGAMVNHQNHKGQTALHMPDGSSAILSNTGSQDCYDALLRQTSIQVDLQDDLGKTPLMVAVALGDMIKANALLREGASVESITHEGHSVLHAASTVDMLKVLLDERPEVLDLAFQTDTGCFI